MASHMQKQGRRASLASVGEVRSLLSFCRGGVSIRLASALAAALALAAAGIASAAPTIVTATATPLAPTPSQGRADVSVSWTVPDGEVSCGIRLGWNSLLGESHSTFSGSSWRGQVSLGEDAKDGRAGTVYVQVSSDRLDTPAAVRCDPFRAMWSPVFEIPVAAFVPPAPAPAPAPTEPAPAATSSSSPAPSQTVEERLAALEAALAALRSRVGALEDANLASWTALVNALAAGALPYEAALAARSAGMNALYRLGTADAPPAAP